MPIRVALVNDYEVVVHGIASMLRTHTHRVEVVELTASQLVEAIEAIAGGRIIVSPAPRGNRMVGGDWPGREEGLTAREAEVLCLITQGLTNAQIVERTSLSINSIKSYIRSCYRKINVDSRSRAVLWGVEHGMQLDRVRIAEPDIPGSNA